MRDTSGRGNDGFFVNQTHYDAAEKALVFDGSDDRIITRLQNPAGDSLFSGSLWYKPKTTNGEGQEAFVWIGTHAAGKAFVLKYNSPNFEFSFYGNDAAFNYSLSGGTWYHIAFAYSGGTASSGRRIWVNGVEVAYTSGASSTALNLDANAQLMIGDRTDNNADLNGSISNFKLYDTALTAQEVKTLYDMGRNGSVANPQPLHIAAPLYAPGASIQTVSSTKTDTAFFSGSSITEIGGLSITIYPKFANSKIYVGYHILYGGWGRNFFRLKRTQGSSTTYFLSDLGPQDHASTSRSTTTDSFGNDDASTRSASLFTLDDANGLEPITYTVEGWTYHASYYVTVNRGYNEGTGSGDITYRGRGISSISAQEVCQ